jgi:deoxyribonuclease IV
MAETQHSPEPAYDVADEYRPEPPPPPQVPAWMDGSIRVGIHTSIAGDLAHALEIAHRLGANALQIFSSSPRMWVRPHGGTRILPADATRFRERRNRLRLGPVVIHDNYLINLASQERVLRARSVQAFHDEIVRAMALGADFLVAHPGCGRDCDRRTAIAAIADGLRQAARGLKLEGGPRILLENTAGQGSSIGSRFEELKVILEACPDLALGICVDTAHLFEAGHDLRKPEGLEGALEEIQSTVGLERVCVVHVNDSKTALGSHCDRHQHIGKGHIGLDAFRRILNHPLLASRPFILETPIDKPGDDSRNVRALWKLVGGRIPPYTTGNGFRRRGQKAGTRRAKRTSRKRIRGMRKPGKSH